MVEKRRGRRRVIYITIKYFNMMIYLEKRGHKNEKALFFNIIEDYDCWDQGTSFQYPCEPKTIQYIKKGLLIIHLLIFNCYQLYKEIEHRNADFITFAWIVLILWYHEHDERTQN